MIDIAKANGPIMVDKSELTILGIRVRYVLFNYFNLWSDLKMI